MTGCHTGERTIKRLGVHGSGKLDNKAFVKYRGERKIKTGAQKRLQLARRHGHEVMSTMAGTIVPPLHPIIAWQTVHVSVGNLTIVEWQTQITIVFP
jgi:hypothetical protein